MVICFLTYIVLFFNALHGLCFAYFNLSLKWVFDGYFCWVVYHLTCLILLNVIIQTSILSLKLCCATIGSLTLLLPFCSMCPVSCTRYRMLCVIAYLLMIGWVKLYTRLPKIDVPALEKRTYGRFSCGYQSYKHRDPTKMLGFQRPT